MNVMSPHRERDDRRLKWGQSFQQTRPQSGLHQLELAPESRYITTFSAHIGLMRYKRLNFGISSAAEIFQNVIRETLEGIDGAINISDDILVWKDARRTRPELEGRVPATRRERSDPEQE